MGNKLSKSLELDPEKVSNGVEVTFWNDDVPYRAVIRPGGEHNEELRKLSEKLMKPYRHSNISFESLPHHIQLEHLATLYSEHGVVSWNEQDFGEPFSKEACKRTMIEVPEWRVFITKQAMELDKFRKKAIEATSGNSAGRLPTD